MNICIFLKIHFIVMRESQWEDNLTWITQFIHSELDMGIFVEVT